MIERKYHQRQLGEGFIHDSIDGCWEPWMKVADEILDWYHDAGRASGSDHVLHHVLFFADSSKSHPHEADIRVLLKACADPRNRVNLILNSRMAEEWANRYSPPTP